ncbi:MAG: dihydrofolate reductase family protein, partial [Tetrasphaera sp.]|nr:dihydrofolate reductase family protein [Tetrasphaera sp.]
MGERPYTVLSCAISLDGYLDDVSGTRLVLSNQADLDRVDAVRAASDAILVGAGTVRADNPRLAVRGEHRRAQRL